MKTDKINELISMGFSESHAKTSLVRTNYNLDQAVEILLSGDDIVNNMNVEDDKMEE